MQYANGYGIGWFATFVIDLLLIVTGSAFWTPGSIINTFRECGACGEQGDGSHNANNCCGKMIMIANAVSVWPVFFLACWVSQCHSIYS